MRKVFVAAVGWAPEGQSGFVLLKDEKGRVVLPIGIGLFEARAISLGLRGIQLSRPTPYDMMKSVLDGLDAEVIRIVVNEFTEDTFFAQITLRTNGGDLDMDARPSDAIALALRTDASIYVVEDVIEEAGLVLPEQSGSEDVGELLRHALRIPDAGAPEAKQDEEPQSELERLKAELQRLVEREEYERAAKLRDAIRALERKNGSEEK